MKLGFIGLGRMGGHMVARLEKGGHEVMLAGRNPEHVAAAAAQTGATATSGLDDLIKQIGEKHPVVWLMVPSDAVDAQLEQLLGVLPAGSTIVDGGNSNYQDSQRREQTVTARGMHFVDVGTSGGILAATAGYCLMVGGEPEVVKPLEPLFECLAQPGGWGYFGPSGAGHFTKMVHNAIEYGMMESLAEGYRLLKTSGDYPELDLGKLGQVWQHGSVVESLLNRLCAEALTANPTLDGIDGYVAETGEARWTLERAKAVGQALPAIQAAMDTRLASQAGQTDFGTQLLAAMRHAFGGHAIGKPEK